MWRRGLTGAVAVAVCTAGVATAAPSRVSCNLVRDAADDGGQLIGGPGVRLPPDPTLEILSADIAADSRQITAVIRVKQLVIPDPQSPLGTIHSLSFKSPESAFELRADASRVAGTQFQLWVYRSDYTGAETEAWVVSRLGDVTGALDVERNEIRIHAPLTLLAKEDQMAEGHVLSHLRVISFIEDLPGGGTSYDFARSTTPYTIGTRSCVRVGR